MGRISQKVEDWVEYTPDVGDNRDDPEPLTVELRPMTGEAWRSYQRGLTIGKGGRKDLARRSEKINGRILAENVRNVRNYMVDGKRITTGEELFKYGEPVVYEDVFEAIMD